MDLRKLSWQSSMLALALALSTEFSPAAPKNGNVPSIQKWDRFELVLQSTVAYPNALHEASLSAEFISPLGETNRVDGFWDGEKNWRIRFAPDMPGQWSYRTFCSDAANTNLNNQIGEFRCVAALTKTTLDRRGPIRVARDHLHFEYADRTPFVWIGDAVWNGARLSDLESWQLYCDVRASQKFTVVQWTAGPEKDFNNETAFTGPKPIGINVNFFKRLDAKIEIANRAGLVCAIAPLQEFGGSENALPEDEAILLLRYAVARWGANGVAWVIAVEGDTLGKRVDRWKRIGRSVFGNSTHAPVILMPGETHWLLDEFRNEAWLDAVALPKLSADENGLQWMLSGPPSVQWRKTPARPVINLSAPPETAADGSDSRRMLWWNLLTSPITGANYATKPIAEWETNIVTNPTMRPQTMPAWRSALFTPGARSVAIAADILSNLDISALRPAQRIVAVQPGFQNPRQHIVAATTEARNLTVVYVPEDRTVELTLSALPKSAEATWFNVRSGDRIPATVEMKANTCQISTPDEGDWLLVLKSGK